MNTMKLNMTSKGILVILSAVFLLGLLPVGINAGPLQKKINTNQFGVAIKGYDTVAYFTEGHAVKGKKKFSYNWSNAKWYFSSAENRDLFAADPDRYAPKYGGYCAGSIAITGKVDDINPKAFKIINGKLYLSKSMSKNDKFAEKANDYIKKADENWVKLNDKN